MASDRRRPLHHPGDQLSRRGPVLRPARRHAAPEEGDHGHLSEGGFSQAGAVLCLRPGQRPSGRFWRPRVQAAHEDFITQTGHGSLLLLAGNLQNYWSLSSAKA